MAIEALKEKAKAYSRQKHRAAMLNIFLPPAVLAALILSGAPAYFKNTSSLISDNAYLNLLAFSILFGLTYHALLLPFEYYSTFMLEHKYSLSNQPLEAWLKKRSKETALSFVIAVPFIYSLYALIRYLPLYWWVIMALLWFSVSILIAKFAPLVLVPIFYRYSPIKEGGLRDKLLGLSSKAGFLTEGVYQIDFSRETKKANAAIIGLGKQKRIILCDTLLNNFTDDEIASVMGHELGHHKLRHILKLTVAGGISALAVFFVTNGIFLALHDKLGYGLLYDFESLVLIYAVISALNIALLPIHNAYSRKLEKEADLFALKITDKKYAFISTMKKLAEQNLADTDPGKLYEIMLYSHPPISRRISFAESFDKSLS